jgi:hypothetical protein
MIRELHNLSRLILTCRVISSKEFKGTHGYAITATRWGISEGHVQIPLPERQQQHVRSIEGREVISGEKKQTSATHSYEVPK